MTNNDSSTSDIEAHLIDALEQIRVADSAQEIERARVEYLGKKSFVTNQLKRVGALPPKERQAFGQAINHAKSVLKRSISDRSSEIFTSEQQLSLKKDRIDVSLSGRGSSVGGLHPVTRTIRRIEDIFVRLGFDLAHGPEIEDDYHNFEALNIPQDHPARAMHDTFYVDIDAVLRTHTSPVQIRYLESRQPPIHVIAPGRVFRCDSDVTHTPMFHQLEGLVVDTNISFADLKGVLVHFLRVFFEQDLSVRFRPSYFPFTEPSAEVDMSCVFCIGSGCRICQSTGWLEILGCGMVHPEVFQKVGLDNDEFTGYAFGVGIERLAMLRYGVDDLRLFFENELGFLTQFG